MPNKLLAMTCLLCGGLPAVDGSPELDPVPRELDGVAVEIGPRLDAGPVTIPPLSAAPAAADAGSGPDAPERPWLNRHHKTLLVNGTLIAGYSLYGASQWDWFTASPHSDSEDWFGSDTKYGGADKLGHAYTAYAGGAALCHLYEWWGYDREAATLLGVGSALLHTTLIEIGDGVSREHGFSWEDQAFNTAGALLQYLRRRFPVVRETVDFRWEYWPSRTVQHGDHYDPLTDYSGSKWLLAWKTTAFVEDASWLRFLEVHTGFYSRGYLSADERWYAEREQELYVGLGLNLAELIGTVTDSKWRRFFNYYQVPYTYLPVGFEP